MNSARAKSRPTGDARVARDVGDLHVVVVRGRVIPHDQPFYQEFAKRVGHLTIIVSSESGMREVERPDWAELDVRVHKGWVLHLPRRHPMRLRDSNSVYLPWGLGGQLRELRPDIVVAHDLGLRTYAALRYALRTKTPFMACAALSEHTERGRGWLRESLRRWIGRRADAVAVNGTSGRRYLTELGFDPQRIHHVPYVPVARAIASDAGERLPPVSHRLLYVGRLIELKGLLPFAAALGRVAARRPAQKIEWVVVGSGPVEEQLRRFPLPPNVEVRFAGRHPIEKLAPWYADAGIFVFSSLCDEWGLVVNEALGSGLPVLGSLYSQAVQDLIDEQCGWTYHTDVPAEVDRALEAALSTSPERLNAMRIAARQRTAALNMDYAVDNYAAAAWAAWQHSLAGNTADKNDCRNRSATTR